jgi:hypothetical protein
LILGAAGFVYDKVTTHWVALDRLPVFGAEPARTRVVEAGKVITAVGVCHPLDNKLKFISVTACGQPSGSFWRELMDSKEPELNPTLADTDSTDSEKTNESVQISRPEFAVDKRPSYLRSRQITLKKFTPKGLDPS